MITMRSLFKYLGVSGLLLGAVLEVFLGRNYRVNFLVLGLSIMAFCAACDGLVNQVAKTGGRPMAIPRSTDPFHYWLTITGWFLGSVILALLACRWCF
jgi:hypothetical protein